MLKFQIISSCFQKQSFDTAEWISVSGNRTLNGGDGMSIYYFRETLYLSLIILTQPAPIIRNTPANISMFTSGATLPGLVNIFSTIPPNKGGKTKRVNMWSVWKWMIALVFKVLGWSRGEWAAKTKRLHRFTLGLHLSLVWTPFKWNALHWRWDRGDFGVLSSIALHGLLFPHIQR